MLLRMRRNWNTHICKISVPFPKIIWEFFKMWDEVTTWPNNSTTRYIPKRNINKNIFNRQHVKKPWENHSITSMGNKLELSKDRCCIFCFVFRQPCICSKYQPKNDQQSVFNIRLWTKWKSSWFVPGGLLYKCIVS